MDPPPLLERDTMIIMLVTFTRMLHLLRLIFFFSELQLNILFFSNFGFTNHGEIKYNIVWISRKI